MTNITTIIPVQDPLGGLALTLGEMLAFNARHFGEYSAFVDGEVTVTYTELELKSAGLAAGFHLAGLRSGDRVSVLAHNGLPFVEIFYAAARIGVIVSAINWRLSPTEIAKVVDNDLPTLIFSSAELAYLLGDVQCEDFIGTPVVIDGNLEGFVSLEKFRADPKDFPQVLVASDDPVCFIHTAWTDGRPKAAVLTHRNLLCGAKQLEQIWELNSHDVHICALPLFHITALSLMLATARVGGCNVLQARFNPAETLNAIEMHAATLMGEFSPMLSELLKQPDSKIRMSSLRHLCGLDMPDVIKSFHASCPKASFWAVYGQSEAGGIISMMPHALAEGSAGYPLTHCQINIVDATGFKVPVGETGEIVVLGPNVFVGYWGRPEVSATTLRDGWLHTGDIGKFDTHGRLIFVGRLPNKELIKSGGENVYPEEVEQILFTHSAIVDVAVIGVPDKRWGESVRAVCVTRSNVEPQELIDFVGERIAKFKRPSSVILVDSLPTKSDGTHDRDFIKATFGMS
jgi:acyl-CoA synthetase (AMP-forming)/AMP-acid ligase II